MCFFRIEHKVFFVPSVIICPQPFQLFIKYIKNMKPPYHLYPHFCLMTITKTQKDLLQSKIISEVEFKNPFDDFNKEYFVPRILVITNVLTVRGNISM